MRTEVINGDVLKMNRNVSQVAQILGTDVQQVKKWAWLFREYLNKGANPGKGLTRVFTDNDVLALMHVAMHWEEEPDIEEIQYGLDGRYDHYRHFLYQNTPILQEPPEDLDETWTHGLLLNGGLVDGYLELARNYKRSADALLDSALERGEEARDWGHPVLFGYRHALELYLKIIGRVEESTHSLRECLNHIEKRHKHKVGSPIREWILEFDKIDPRGTAFRYADGEAWTLRYAEFWVDFLQLKHATSVIFEALDHCVLTLESNNALPVPTWLLREHQHRAHSQVP